MPILRQPEHLPQSRRLISPNCPACGRSMRLISVTPSQHHRNLAMWTYRCQCGEVTEDIIPNEN
jgi:hypothetical protein